MKKVMIISLMCFLGIFSAWSEEKLLLEGFEREYIYKEEKILVKAEKINQVYVLTKVYRGKKVIFHRKRAAMGEGLQKIKFVSPLLFLFWGSGIHGEHLTVLDVEKNRAIWEQSSSWPINLTIYENKIEVYYTGDKLKPGKYEEFTKIFYL